MSSLERDLRADLDEQMYFLRASMEAYDRGAHIEAKRLAVTIRVLVHDTRMSRSLLGQMGVKERLRWLFSGGGVHPANLLSTLSLTIMRLGGDGNGMSTFEYVPRQEDDMIAEGVLTDFEIWWNAPVIKDSEQQEFSRKDLVLGLANKDGGAHIDNLQRRLRALAHEGSSGWYVATSSDPIAGTDGTSELVTITPILASVRTIAGEVALTLHNQTEVIDGHLPRP
ncbi:hypothetical protein GS439_19345 [Rhodococcus hoagii]|nr:hypothetical protein [Prescottella equi]NKT15589.1 hypothetical protein [Prescottella equi]NKW47548.1 hypothetical protein [Prescottella equi]